MATCDYQSIMNAAIANSPTVQPKPICWTGAVCTGSQFTIPIGVLIDISTLPKLTGIWIPPNLSLDTYSYLDTTPLTERLPPIKLPAGLYTDLANNVEYNYHKVTKIMAYLDKPWNSHVLSCCTGKAIDGASMSSCGMWWGKIGNNGMCDDVMDSYCNTHPTDPKCSCYSIPPNPKDNVANIALKANPSCWSQTCATKGYMPSNLITKVCPSFKVCIQDISLPGTNNILKDYKIIQDCSTTVLAPEVIAGNPNPTNTPPIDKPMAIAPDYTNIMYMFIAFLCIMLVYLAIYPINEYTVNNKTSVQVY
jgi:hypothetical protein